MIILKLRKLYLKFFQIFYQKGEKTDKSPKQLVNNSTILKPSSIRNSQQIGRSHVSRLSANPLDSNPPILTRGKESLKPKNKKHSTLKKVCSLQTMHLNIYIT